MNFYELPNAVLQFAIQFDILRSGKESAYYGSEERKCNGSCSAGNQTAGGGGSGQNRMVRGRMLNNKEGAGEEA